MKRRAVLSVGVAVVGFATILVSRNAQAQSTCGSLGSPYSGTCFVGYTKGSGTVYAYDDSSGVGVTGISYSSYGVEGSSSTGIGGYFTTLESSQYALEGYTSESNGTGAYGYATGSNSTGVIGTGVAYGVYGTCSGTGCYAGYFSGAAKVTGELYVGSCSGCTSDARLKKNVEPLKGALDRLLQLKGVTYEWIDPSAHDHEAGHGQGMQTGFIAQDVEKVFPNWVKEDGYTAKDGEKYKTLELRQIEALEVESIRTLKQENDDLKARVRALENGRSPIVSSANAYGLGFLGLAIGGAIVFNKRKKNGENASQ